MTRTYIATVLNFFFPGAGYLVLGQRRARAVLFLIGVVGLTYVETSLKTAAPDLYWPMFASVFLMNTGFAIDAFLLGKAQASPAGQPTTA